MRRLILGTAGHIDHGKTALVRYLTGVDTDRLKEEKARGITVDLGFAELVTPQGIHFGVVDVPGHEGFIRNMVAGATGMDVVLLVVAADEGAMPQTREHLAIVRLLGVPRLLVALTKSDLVEEEWLELATDDVRETLADTPYAGAPVLPVSSVSGKGVDALLTALEDAGAQGEEKGRGDLVRLPIDRVFTIRGAGTVVTGTLWTGTVRVGDRVRILPGDQEARIRSVQLHNHDVEEAPAGARVALGLTGSGIHHETLSRGQTLVGGEGWEESWMLTCRISVLPDTGWVLEQGQRVRVHLGTAEVLARAAILESDLLAGGEEGWVQLRLEEPLLARGRDHLVLRSYSPVTTIGGGRVVEPRPPKRRNLRDQLPGLLETRLRGDCPEAMESLLVDRGWAGVAEASLPHRTGFSPEEIRRALDSLLETRLALRAEGHLFSHFVVEAGRGRITAALVGFHETHPLRAGMPLEELRQVLPNNTGPGLPDQLIQEMAGEEELAMDGGLVRLSGFRRTLTPDQEVMREQLRAILREAGLSPPGLETLPRKQGMDEAELHDILRFMEAQGEVLGMEGGLFFWRPAVMEGGKQVVAALGGAEGLGPADFREVLGVTRKYLLPLLRYMDTEGVTTRFGDQRTVARALPEGWGTFRAQES